MQRRGKVFISIAFALAFIVYQIVIHRITAYEALTPPLAALVLLPFCLVSGWAISLELGWRAALLIISGLVALGALLVNQFGLPNPALILGLPHLVTNLFLMWFFAHTLKSGRKPLITSIAERIHGSLSVELQAYTRRVTWAWSLFFALQILASIIFYIFAPIRIWSLFITMLNAPLIILMFVVEYSYRVLRFRDHASSIFSGMHIFSHYSQPDPLGPDHPQPDHSKLD